VQSNLGNPIKGSSIKSSSTGIGRGLDIIVLTRPGARNADRAALRAALDEQFQRLIRRAANP
jgi:RNase P protein component